MSKLFPPERVMTKVVGVTMGSRALDGIPVRQKYIQAMQEKQIQGLKLLREPDNKYDAHAIAVYVELPAGRCQLGYIQNRTRVCPVCSKEYPRVDAGVELCTNSVNGVLCGAHLNRVGLASELSHWIDQGYEYKARVAQVTGGGEDKSLGVNIVVELSK